MPNNKAVSHSIFGAVHHIVQRIRFIAFQGRNQRRSIHGKD
ncbi:Uncharacterised protein [Vibrio cholerae]|nr:Uncharacterised protein [Vibrio cholerae]